MLPSPKEWYEFTPYETGIPKYGVFMNTKDFASKFYMGEKIKSFPEVRLHFLYGVWGSAFLGQFPFNYNLVQCSIS